MADHDIRVYEGHSVELEAHKEVWVMAWSEFEGMGGRKALGSMPCPGCGVGLDDTEGSFTLGRAIPGISAN